MNIRKFEFPLRVSKAYTDKDGLKHVIGVASDNRLDHYKEYFALSALEDMVKAARSTKPNKPEEGLVDLMETHYETFGFGYAVDGWINKNPEADSFEFWVDFALRPDAWPGNVLYDEVKNKQNVKQLSVGGYIEDEDDIVFEDVEFEDDEGNVVEMRVTRLEHIVLEHVATTPEGWAANPRTRFEGTEKSVKGNSMIKSIFKSLSSDSVQKQIQENTKMIQKGAVPKHSTPVSDQGSWDADAAVSKIRKWASSDDSGDKDKISWSKYRKAFGWYDSDDQENFGAYKLPHHTVEDGKLKLVKNGLTAAMAALNGARGGVDIPEDDRQSVYNHLKRHYSDIDEDPPELKSKSEDGDKITLSKIATIVKQVIDETFGTERNKAMDKEKALEQIEKMREEFDDETLKSLGLSVEEEDSEEEESEEEEEESEEEDVDVEKSIQEALEPISEKLKSLPESYVEEEKVSDLEEKVKSLSEKMDTLKSALEDKEKEISELKSTVESLSPGSHDEEGERTKSTDGEDEDEDVEDDDVDSEDIDYETLWD
jgi:hypothetical protein